MSRGAIQHMVERVSGTIWSYDGRGSARSSWHRERAKLYGTATVSGAANPRTPRLIPLAPEIHQALR